MSGVAISASNSSQPPLIFSTSRRRLPCRHRLLRLPDLVALSDDDNLFAAPPRPCGRTIGSANKLISLTRINAEPHRQFDRFVELRKRDLFQFRDRFFKRVLLCGSTFSSAARYFFPLFILPPGVSGRRSVPPCDSVTGIGDRNLVTCHYSLITILRRSNPSTSPFPRSSSSRIRCSVVFRSCIFFRRSPRSCHVRSSDLFFVRLSGTFRDTRCLSQQIACRRRFRFERERAVRVNRDHDRDLHIRIVVLRLALNALQNSMMFTPC